MSDSAVEHKSGPAEFDTVAYPLWMLSFHASLRQPRRLFVSPTTRDIQICRRTLIGNIFYDAGIFSLLGTRGRVEYLLLLSDTVRNLSYEITYIQVNGTVSLYECARVSLSVCVCVCVCVRVSGPRIAFTRNLLCVFFYIIFILFTDNALYHTFVYCLRCRDKQVHRESLPCFARWKISDGIRDRDRYKGRGCIERREEGA